MGKVVLGGGSLYVVGSVMGFLYLASEGGVTPGMDSRQFYLALFVYGPAFLLAMGVFESAVNLVVVEIPRRVWRWYKNS